MKCHNVHKASYLEHGWATACRAPQNTSPLIWTADSGLGKWDRDEAHTAVHVPPRLDSWPRPAITVLGRIKGVKRSLLVCLACKGHPQGTTHSSACFLTKQWGQKALNNTSATALCIWYALSNSFFMLLGPIFWKSRWLYCPSGILLFSHRYS